MKTNFHNKLLITALFIVTTCILQVSIYAQSCTFNICAGESITLTHSVAGSTVTWYDVNGNLIGTGDQMVTPASNTSYYCIAINDTDCTYSEPLYCVVVVNKPFNGEIPLVFTPNGDGDNDEWCPNLICLDNLDIVILSTGRGGGQVVYQSNNLGDCWNGSGLDAGTFAVTITSTQFNFTGFITLLP